MNCYCYFVHNRNQQNNLEYGRLVMDSDEQIGLAISICHTPSHSYESITVSKLPPLRRSKFVVMEAPRPRHADRRESSLVFHGELTTINSFETRRL
ncbi:hypothetical protein CDAR_211901 [Caerostris darwini]|uniref:Uncharacterized protein n=1 Tax=Caerostris darwini TaxID=1538125 RepID=A0AAV4PFR3_9ARAC|nr:hypothetical protein CDAR_211901 [Caerostris darwini]